MPAITATWKGGLQFEHRSPAGHTLATDAPVQAGGGGTAPTPMELVVMALIGCTGVDVAGILAGMRQPLRALEISAHTERAVEHPRIFTRIDLKYRFSGDLDRRKVERAVALSVNKYCSVSAMLAGKVELAHAIEITP